MMGIFGKYHCAGVSRRATRWIAATIVMAGFVSCDDGRIYDDGSGSGSGAPGGITVRFSGTLNGTSGYPSGYTVALAGFTDDSDYAEISKNLSDGDSDVILSGVGENVIRMEVCLLNSIRKRVVTFASVDVAEGVEILTFEAGTLEVSHYDAIERGVFAASCARCHGAGGFAAAGLSLLKGESRQSLVGVESSVIPGLQRVSPGSADMSTLWLAVGTDISDEWAFSHRELLDADRRALILSWINNLPVNSTEK